MTKRYDNLRASLQGRSLVELANGKHLPLFRELRTGQFEKNK